MRRPSTVLLDASIQPNPPHCPRPQAWNQWVGRHWLSEQRYQCCTQSSSCQNHSSKICSPQLGCPLCQTKPKASMTMVCLCFLLLNVQSYPTCMYNKSAVEGKITATFLEYEHQTQYWTSEDLYINHMFDCTCNSLAIALKPVDLIDTLGTLKTLFRIISFWWNFFPHLWITTISSTLPVGQSHKKLITFCKCLDNCVWLVHLGYLPSSPHVPHTTFSIWLLQLHHKLWKTSAISTWSFIKSLTMFLIIQCHSQLLSQSETVTTITYDGHSLSIFIYIK